MQIIDILLKSFSTLCVYASAAFAGIIATFIFDERYKMRDSFTIAMFCYFTICSLVMISIAVFT